MKPMINRVVGFSAALFLGGVGAVSAASVAFSMETQDGGTGFGTVLSVLSFQNNGSEWGTVWYDVPNSKDVLTGDAKNNAGTATRTVAEMSAKGIDGGNLGIIFNIAEPGNATTVTLAGFSLVFQSDTGSTLFTADYNPGSPLTLSSDDQGTGNSGFLFRVKLVGSELDFFNNSANRLGMRVESNKPIGLTAGGQENFYLAPAAGGLTVPVPASVWGGSLLLGMMLSRRVVSRLF